ncbi:unnamed protein product [Kluyveromyces dobzhanskii CBS 2104]|uniref:WGS project CCBQ000000000 data, contig 00272 n=1 Tax=Kluyveromyces dobzhanskii CBS 2104 TaxID=1427455 RepID=A0A0A8LAZ9_9SACH|nr:unnamed protein product [Kluyveromyces dobzhanskii CBS 2104]
MHCRSMLEIDASLMDLSMAQRGLLVSSETNTNDKHFNANNPQISSDKLKLLKETKQPDQLRLSKPGSKVSDSYVFLTETEYSLQKSKTGGDESGDEEDEDDRNKTLSSRINALGNIFSILSSKNNIDYPVCQGCCDFLLEKLKEEYNQELKKRDTYFDFVKRIQEHKNSNGAVSDSSKTPDELSSLKREKEQLLQELQQLEDVDEKLQKEIEQLQNELTRKKEEDYKRLQKENLQELEQLTFVKDVQSLKNQRVLTLNHIDKLRKLNIYNETFRISHNGPFGTINDLRLGSIPSISVPWLEINSALGQVVLLLSLIGEKLSVSLSNYRLKPMGSTSSIEKLDTQTNQWISHKAYSGNEFSLGSLFHKESAIDKALLCMLEIISRLSAKVSADSQDPASIELPYEISVEKINGLTILLNGSAPSLEWTTACKFLLTNVKWLLAFSTANIDKNKPKYVKQSAK